MITVNSVTNVNQALAEGLRTLHSRTAREESSRNGPVRVAPGPVVTETLMPLQRVLFSPKRNANPFFHLMESLWMLAGRDDLPWLAYYNKQMATYSDDGGMTQPAAYGNRWRRYFGYDQIEMVVRELTANPNSRRAVLAMWNPGGARDNDILIGVCDGYAALNGSKDVPCNTNVYFQLRTDRDGTHLDMTVCCRSNDIWWGAHGANAVHFSVLMEYVAALLSQSLNFDIRVGTMVQFSNNYHLYTEVVGAALPELALDAADHDYYVTGPARAAPVAPTPIFGSGLANVATFDEELADFVEWASPREVKQAPRSEWGGTHLFLKETAAPMVQAWDQHKRADYWRAIGLAHQIHGEDWHTACIQWLARTMDRRASREQ